MSGNGSTFVTPDLTAVEPSLSLLEWDSAEFGFPVGKINGADVSEAVLARLLQQSRDLGLALVYWFRAESDLIAKGSPVLTEFTGNLITRQATFKKRLRSPITAQRWSVGGISVVDYPPGPPCTELMDLGLAAGTESRFRVDPRFPRLAFEHLYSTWVQRSTVRALADVVLVAREGSTHIVGFVTVKRKEADVGAIGLIAVAGSVRSRGVGRMLLEAADEWMVQQALSSAQVITQLSNSAACRLYERNGYSLASVESVYHFWPQVQVRKASLE